MVDDFNRFISAMLSDDSHSRRDTAEASRNDDLEGERNGLLPDTFQLKTFVSWKYRAATVKSQAKRGGRMRTVASRFMYLSAGPQLVLPEGVLQPLAGALLQDTRCRVGFESLQPHSISLSFLLCMEIHRNFPQ